MLDCRCRSHEHARRRTGRTGTLVGVAIVGVDTWHWDEASFVRAWEHGVFGDARVELIEGEVWPVSIGDWHGAVAASVTRALPNDQWRVTMSTLPAAGSLPDPDVWVRRRSARPISGLGETGRLLRWSPADVALVVEVSDTSFAADTETKAVVYGRAGFGCYWVVHRGGVDVFTDPFESGYRSRERIDERGSVAVPYGASTTIAIASLLDADA